MSLSRVGTLLTTPMIQGYGSTLPGLIGNRKKRSVTSSGTGSGRVPAHMRASTGRFASAVGSGVIRPTALEQRHRQQRSDDALVLPAAGAPSSNDKNGMTVPSAKESDPV
jgi:hypothetical protein